MVYTIIHRLVFMTLYKAVFGRNKRGGLRVFFVKDKGANTFFNKK